VISLPIALALTLGAEKLLAALKDDAGALFLSRIALALGLVWLLSLVGLTAVLGMRAIAQSESEVDEESEPPFQSV
jgi:hypothetical protein